MQVFNVDELSKESRSIKLDGVEHEIVDMTVDSYLEAIKTAEIMQNKPTPEQQVEALVSTVHHAIPSLTKEKVRKLPFNKLNAISQFVRGEVPDALKDAIKPVETAEATDATKSTVEAKN